MARTTRDDEPAARLSGTIRDMCEALRLLEKDITHPAISQVRAIGERALKTHTAPGYSATVAQEELAAAPSRVGEASAAARQQSGSAPCARTSRRLTGLALP